MRVISGYKGGNEIYLAMDRGEVDGRCGGLVSSINATRPDWFPQRKITVPIVVAHERSRQILELFVAPQAMDRPILAPPGVPSERVAALRSAFHAAMNDAGFIAEARRQHLQIAEVDGTRVAKTVSGATSSRPRPTR